MLRSVAVYYSGGVMGKRKYQATYRDSSYAKNNSKAVCIAVNSCPLPRLVPYNKLMPYIKSIDIGQLYSVRDTLCYDLEEEEKADGMYREVKQLLLSLAKFYLSQSRYQLIWFQGQVNTFHVSLGGDGAPFGKDDTACAWLVSLLNIGRGVLSSNENFLLFGANCKEDCVPVSRFLVKLVSDISEIEKNTYSVDCSGVSVDVKFCFSELPNDMKMLCFLAELSNSATYFSTFADVSTATMNELDGTFGSNGKETWKPWKYESRVDIANQVDKFKKSLAKQKMSESTRRSKITNFIAQRHSRQEFKPAVGKLIDRAHVDPQHLKNNACALVHRQLLNEVIAMSKLSNDIKFFLQVSPNSHFHRYVTAMPKWGLSRLAKRVVKWFDETKANGKQFEYRFTRKDSRLFLLHFMSLISAVESRANPGREVTILHVIAYICLCLRDCVSLFSRLEVTDEQVSELKAICTRYLKANAIFFHVNPTVWTIGHIVPAHAQDMKSKYGLGLGLNSMEGREAKHVFISKYSNNTMFYSCWEHIFLHEFVSLLWLRGKGYNWSNANSSCLSYIPKQVNNSDPAFCNCGLQKGSTDNKCIICSNSLRAKIEASVKEGKNLISM